ncbi:MAG: MFS transporter [Chloroflexi bacterium]|nr:MAG: hypothetical protein CUN54_00355 [Phototrophicales bacterium]RMF79716.1 MAG: MFS transporter [Chloroflexota bacterium]
MTYKTGVLYSKVSSNPIDHIGLIIKLKRDYDEKMLTSHKIQNSRIVSQSPIFYGWVIWVVATLGLIATAPGQTFTVSWFFDRFIEDFELSRTSISTLYGIGTFVGALSLTWVGRQVDRYGTRYSVMVVGGLFTLTLFAMSSVVNPVMLLFGFIALRGLGQGSLTLISTNVVGLWFQERRGRMMSLMLVGIALFQRIYVPWLQQTLEKNDWREVWIMLGIVIGITLLPAMWIFMRDAPEQFGLHPDGRQTKIKNVNTQDEHEDDWTLAEARRTSIFWIFVAGRFIPPAWGTGMILHQISIFAGQGHSERVAAQTFGTIALIAAGAYILTGAMVDRFHPGRIMALQLTALSIAMFVAMNMSSSAALRIYAIAFGFMMGTGGVFDGAVWTNLFGRKHIGEIRGFVSTGVIIGSAVGPVIFAVSFDHLGGYAPIFWLGIVLSAIPLILTFFARLPQRRSIERIKTLP